MLNLIHIFKFGIEFNVSFFKESGLLKEGIQHIQKYSKTHIQKPRDFHGKNKK